MQPNTAAPAFSPARMLQEDADRLGAALDEHLRRHFAPDREKSLRSFSSSEVAELLGITPAHLRTMRHEGKLPDVGSEDGRRSLQFTAEEIYRIREALESGSRKKGRYLPRRRNSEQIQVIAISSFKGGASKSTTAAHLAAGLAMAGLRVAVCDLDPQSSISTYYGFSPDIDTENPLTIYDAISFENRQPMAKVMRKTFFHNIDIAPASLMLAEFEQYAAFHARQGTGEEPWFTRLASAIRSVESSYDVVLLDCPPALGMITLSAMVAATSMIIPVVPSMIDVASLSHFTRMSSDMMGTLEEFGARFDYDFVRYLIARHEPTDGPQAQLAAFLRMQFGERVMASTFLKSTVISDAGMTNQTLYEIRRSDVTRSAYDRARESVDAVRDEVLDLLNKAWGRS